MLSIKNHTMVMYLKSYSNLNTCFKSPMITEVLQQYYTALRFLTIKCITLMILPTHGPYIYSIHVPLQCKYGINNTPNSTCSTWEILTHHKKKYNMNLCPLCVFFNGLVTCRNCVAPKERYLIIVTIFYGCKF